MWAMEHEESFDRYTKYDFDNNFLMVFISERLSDSSHKYAVMAADVCIMSKDIVISSLILLFYTKPIFLIIYNIQLYEILVLIQKN